MTAIAEMTFEAALKELEGLVRRLEDGQVNLEEAVVAYERGMQLKTYCEDKLRQARMRIEQISFAADGTPTVTAPLAPAVPLGEMAGMSPGLGGGETS
jgi:exodeoxyribonuclease VII small subunit